MKKIHLLVLALLAISNVPYNIATAQTTAPERQIQWNSSARETRLSFTNGELITDFTARKILGQEGYDQLHKGLVMDKYANVFCGIGIAGIAVGTISGILWGCGMSWAMTPTIIGASLSLIGLTAEIVFVCIRNPIYRDLVTKYNTGQLAFNGNGEMMLTYKPALRISAANQGIGIALKF